MYNLVCSCDIEAILRIVMLITLSVLEFANIWRVGVPFFVVSMYILPKCANSTGAGVIMLNRFSNREGMLPITWLIWSQLMLGRPYLMSSGLFTTIDLIEYCCAHWCLILSSSPFIVRSRWYKHAFTLCSLSLCILEITSVFQDGRLSSFFAVFIQIITSN